MREQSSYLLLEQVVKSSSCLDLHLLTEPDELAQNVGDHFLLDFTVVFKNVHRVLEHVTLLHHVFFC